ncbi:MAG: Rieske (2Fe-2S) protein [Acidobacteriota bacterium]
MLRVQYTKLVPYPYDVVFSQYWDYEHIEHVHPDSLGEYRLVKQEKDLAIYEQLWPERRGRRKRSLVEQRYEPPDTLRFDFVDGLHKGVVVETRLEEHPEGTLVHENYGIPNLPNWRFLRWLARPSVVKQVDLVWQEDLDVEVCHGGWPGLPESSTAKPGTPPELVRLAADGWHDVAGVEELQKGRLCTELQGREIVLVEESGELHALENRCPHTGGPLALGHCADGAIACPWHGARFDLATGACLSGPSPEGVQSLETRVADARILVRARDAQELREEAG